MITCRACSLETSDFTSIYSKKFGNTLAEMLQTLVPVRIPDPADRVLMVLCAECVDKTIDAYQFVQLVLRADSQWASMQPVCDLNAELCENTLETPALALETDGTSNGVEELVKDDEDSDTMGKIVNRTSPEPDTALSTPGARLKHVKYFPLLADGDCSFRCCGRKCLLTFSSREELEKHGAANHGVHQRALSWKDSFQYECTVCFTRFEHRKNLITHLRRLVRDYQCPVCMACFDRPRLKLAHVNQQHPDYLHKVARKSYRLEAQPTKICCGCGERFDTLETLLAHGANEHTPVQEDEHRDSEAEYKFQCKICYKRFRNRANLQHHHRSKYLEKRFACGQCGDTFAYRSLLEGHQQTHTTERNYVCETCGATFKTKVGLVAHDATHREKTFQCTECDYRAVKESRLKSHMLRHGNKMPFLCQQCPKQFRTKSNLASHMRSHAGVKSFQCRHCDRSYVYVSDRAKHERTHSGDLPHGCSDCGKKYSRPCLLKAHVKICKPAKNSKEACDY
uniref:Protein krueppel n=1 Tax=Anopheles atroparvus TaxID=41427 RepID=A0A182IWG0_ANOAO